MQPKRFDYLREALCAAQTILTAVKLSYCPETVAYYQRMRNRNLRAYREERAKAEE